MINGQLQASQSKGQLRRRYASYNFISSLTAASQERIAWIVLSISSSRVQPSS